MPKGKGYKKKPPTQLIGGLSTTLPQPKPPRKPRGAR